jgi:alpha-amylase/alpha-mannosidase (GH57 family)
MTAGPVQVAFLWHMHQPSYRDPLDGTVVLPWVRLHALKDYLGMIELLAETPTVHATFNLVPSLLDQLDQYVRGEALDPHLMMSRKPAAALTEHERLFALRSFFMAHHENVIGRFPRFAELLQKRGPSHDEAALRGALPRFTDDDFRDLQVLANLAWFDLSWQKADPETRALVEKGRHFTEDDKRVLTARERALLAGILPSYRRAQDERRVELSTSPYYHPILPLLCDSDAHREAHPGAFVPRRFRHPEDAADQILRALERHTAAFGRRPAGLWPSEGSVSEEAVTEIARAGLRWTATDEGILERSAGRPIHRDSRGTAHPVEVLYRSWVRRTEAGEIAMFFRDRTLSDLIGFSYSSLDPERAAHDLLDRCRRVGEHWYREQLEGTPTVSIILDGENAWEHFREGGREFLRLVYQGLAQDSALRAVTLSEALNTAPRRELPRVFAGSWIHSDFSVWIGHADDRRAWDLLGEARDALESRTGLVPPEAHARALEAFRAACGSDWCWWYGSDHSSEIDFEFDRLFRRHLRAIYENIGLPAPHALDETLITTRQPEVRQSRPAGLLSPLIDGEIAPPEEWAPAGVHRAASMGSMHRATIGVRTIHFGLGGERVFVLVETAPGPARELLESAALVVAFPGPEPLRYRIQGEPLTSDGGPSQVPVLRERFTELGWKGEPTRARAAANSVVELEVPLSELQPSPEQTVSFRVLVLQGGTELERHPDAAPIAVGLEEVTRV